MNGRVAKKIRKRIFGDDATKAAGRRSQAHRLYPDNGTPLTSIRRAITVLTNKGLLQKTDEQISGVYGKPEYVWKYKRGIV